MRKKLKNLLIKIYQNLRLMGKIGLLATKAKVELDQDSVWVLPDEFEDNQLAEALCSLWRNKEHRDDLSQRVSRVIA